MNNYDLLLILSAISNQINDIERYDKHNLKLYSDYKHLYFVLRKKLLDNIENVIRGDLGV